MGGVQSLSKDIERQARRAVLAVLDTLEDGAAFTLEVRVQKGRTAQNLVKELELQQSGRDKVTEAGAI